MRRALQLSTQLFACLLGILAALTLPALAATGAGGEVDPFVYRLMVFVIAIFVGYCDFQIFES